jgi:hypothetical protein
MPRLKFGQIDRLHLVQVDESSSFCLGALQPTRQPFELRVQQFIVGLVTARAEYRLPLHQDVRLQQCLAQVLPDQRVERLRPS